MNARTKTDINIERVIAHIEKIATFNATPAYGCSRFSYSMQDQQARDFLLQEFARLGLKVKVDAVGNIRARLEGKIAGLMPVMIGSHIDTVLHGGKYDGVAGVAAALEVVTQIVERDLEIARPVEIVVFAEEEGSNFGATTAGSKAMTGAYGEEELRMLLNDKGQSMFAMAAEFGLHPERVVQDRLCPGDIHAMIELHIEQSVNLEQAGMPIGVVQAIAGGKWYRVSFEGVGNHAGATPMHLRQDPMVAAARAILRLNKLATEQNNCSAVVTIGRIVCEPNVSNCIANKVMFTLDIRDVRQSGIDAIVAQLEPIIRETAQTDKVEAKIEFVGGSDPIRLSEYVISVIESAARDCNIPYMKMNSGAVHDAAQLAKITDTGMIFIPSVNGRSHAPDEESRAKDIELGCILLLQALLRLANDA